jgi:surfactin synthase thioesterase subunit
VLFPHAGAGPYALNGLVAALPPDTEAFAVALPGRERRLAEPPDTTVAEVLAAVDRGLAHLPPLPTLVLGCSVGALLAVRFAARPASRCEHVVVAAQVPGPGPRRPSQATSTDDLLSLLRQAGDVPPGLLDDELMRSSFLARLAADLRLGAQAEQGFGDARVTVPITVLGGRADPLVPVRDLVGWAEHTTRDCRVVLLDGGHFAFLAPANRHAVASAIGPAVFSMLPAAGGDTR